MNRTRLKEFININIYINVYIPDFKEIKKSGLNLKKSYLNLKKSYLNKKQSDFFGLKYQDFFNPVRDESLPAIVLCVFCICMYVPGEAAVCFKYG